MYGPGELLTDRPSCMNSRLKLMTGDGERPLRHAPCHAPAARRLLTWDVLGGGTAAGAVCCHQPAREPGGRRRALITFPKLKSWRVSIAPGSRGRVAALHRRAE